MGELTWQRGSAHVIEVKDPDAGRGAGALQGVQPNHTNTEAESLSQLWPESSWALARRSGSPGDESLWLTLPNPRGNPGLGESSDPLSETVLFTVPLCTSLRLSGARPLLEVSDATSITARDEEERLVSDTRTK